jgi:hypothetical protein
MHYFEIIMYVISLLFKDKYKLTWRIVPLTFTESFMMFHNIILKCHFINVLSQNPATCLIRDETPNYQWKRYCVGWQSHLMICQRWVWITVGKNPMEKRGIYPSVTLSITNALGTVTGFNPGPSDEKPASNCLICG